MRMNKSYKFLNVIMVMVCACLTLSGCNNEDVGPTVSFGTEDILSEGKVLGVLGEGKNDSEKTEDSQKESSSAGEKETSTNKSSGLKTATSLNVNNLPDDIEDMVELCDALSITSVEMGTSYGNSPEYVWTAVHNAIMNADYKKDGYEIKGDVILADPKIADGMIRAMFGKVKNIPDIPMEMSKEPDEGVPAEVSIGNDFMYHFSLGDRGDSWPEVRRATLYSDGSGEMEVALLGGPTAEEIVSFIYSLRVNTKDTSASAQYDYEITGQRPANRETSNKMNGVPFITMVMQNYPTGVKSELLGQSVEEIPYFNSYNRQRAKDIDALNARISYEIMEYAMENEQDGQWHEICTYPVSNMKYVQAAVTYSRWPNYGTDGNIRTYNFDVSGMKALDINDAYALCNMTADQLTKDIRRAYVPGNDKGKIDRIEIGGFLIKEDGSVDFYAVLYIDGTVDEPFDRIVAINSQTKKMRYIFESDEGVVSEEEDAFNPPLTHGK